MTDNQNQVENFGVVGEQGQRPQSQQQRGVPGTNPPPVPSQAEVQRVMNEQARQRRLEVAETQRRATMLAKTSQPGQAVHGMELPQRRLDIYSQHQEHTDMTQQDQTTQPPVPGMTAQQVFAGTPTQPQTQYQPDHRMDESRRRQQPRPQHQFEQYAEPDPIKKSVVPWYPHRSKGVNVELEDSIITLVPKDGVAGEGNAQSKVVLALFSEILALRDRIQEMQGIDARVRELEIVLYQQRSELQSQARVVQNQAAVMTEKGYAPDRIASELSVQNESPGANLNGSQG